MKQISCPVEIVDGRAWAHLSSTHAVGRGRIHELLRWLVEQINFGNLDCTCDDSGRVESVVIGAAASPPFDDEMVKGVQKRVQVRIQAVNIAGLFAKAREEGVEPKYAEFVARATATAQPAAYDNTDLHYALELIGVLERISKLSFVFDAPPIKSKAGEEVVALLREATRAYLFGHTRSCVSLCRALLEAALREKVPEADLLGERSKTRMGELECLIDLAASGGYLPRRLVTKAHAVRKAGNRALHQSPPGDQVAWRALVDTRAIISRVHQ